MEITEEQYARIKDSLPLQRGNVSLSNLQVLNAILYVAEQGCKWRGRCVWRRDIPRKPSPTNAGSIEHSWARSSAAKAM
jgi:transposase